MDNQLLVNFYGGYFNQDWSLDADSPEDVLRLFLSSEPTEVVKATISEMKKLSAIGDELKLKQIVIHDLGCYYDPTLVGKTMTEWIVSSVDFLETQLTK